MNNNNIEILLIEDNPHEAELAIRSLKKNNIANNIVHIDDGADALDYIMGTGKYAEGHNFNINRLILLDLNLPRVDGLEILRQVKSNDKNSSVSYSDRGCLQGV